jgi:RHS repeat-associated protein
VTSYVYDPESRVVGATDPDGRIRSLAYSPETSLSQFTEKDGGVWTFRYDPGMGTLTEKADPLGNTTWYAYDQNRNLSSLTDPNGNQTSFTHDANKNTTSATDALGDITLYAYNSLNQVTGITYPGDAVVTLTYDEKGNLTSATDPLGNQTRYTYDSKGNLLSVLSPLSQVTAFAYDSHDYLTSLTDPAGAVTSLGYDASGRLVSHEDPLQNKTALDYNGLSRITRMTDPKGNSLAYAYDLSGNPTERTDAKSRKTSYEYNYRGQVTKITDALSNATRLSYGSGCPSCNGVDRLTSLTDARGNPTVFEYDLSGRLVKETSPMGYSKSYAYDPSGNRLTLTDEKGEITLYSYDPLNRLRSIRYPDGDTTAFDYDNRGNLTQAANQNISYTFTHDLNNRMTGVSDSLGRSILYQYDALGKRTRMTGPDGKTISYQYDVANRLSEIITQVGTFAFSHDPIGRRTGLSYPNGVQTDYAYDPSGYLTNLSAGISQKPTISSFAYAHDAVGNRTLMTDLSGNHEYAYDAIDQLTRAAHPTLPPEQFQYDPVGNRQTTVVDSDNALLEDEDFVYTYDAQGNRIEKTSKITGGKTTYAYDPDNRLLKVETFASLARYKYDPFGRRIEKEANGQVTRYVYDGPNILLEYDGQNNIKSSYLHTLAIDDPLALEQNGKAYYYHKDGLGSIQTLTDEAGQVIQSYEYAGFGKITSQSGSLEQPFTFTGRELDQMLAQEEITSWITYSTELKPGVQDPQGMKGGGRIEIKTLRQTEALYFYRARYYDPRAGRFLTKDPIGFAGGDVNLYRYVRNNPINRVDPFGLHEENDVHLIFTYQRALIAGIDPATAWEIAWECRRVDMLYLTRPDRPISWVTGLLWYFHFHPRDKWLEKRLRRCCEKQAPKCLGENLHPLEDSFPHLDLNSNSRLFSLIAPFFHLREPDTDLFFGNTSRDQAMQQEVDYWLREFRKAYYGPYPHPNNLPSFR